MTPKPTDRTLADMWESYARMVIPPGTSAEAIKNNQFAFYGGASCVLDILNIIAGNDVSEQTGVDTLERLHQELRTFAVQQGARPETVGWSEKREKSD
jgi:hypothetical protein